MKKIVSLVLALLMVSMLGITAFAAPNPPNMNNPAAWDRDGYVFFAGSMEANNYQESCWTGASRVRVTLHNAGPAGNSINMYIYNGSGNRTFVGTVNAGQTLSFTPTVSSSVKYYLFFEKVGQPGVEVSFTGNIQRY